MRGLLSFDLGVFLKEGQRDQVCFSCADPEGGTGGPDLPPCKISKL